MAAVPVILDTDMDTDCDDAGALATIHALARAGSAELLACVCDAPAAWGPSCIRAINRWYGAEIPVGSTLARHPLAEARYADYREHLQWIRGSSFSLYNERVARQAGLADPPAAEDAVAVYRRALARSPGGVVIIAVGLLTALADLLDSPPDAESPLSGEALVASRVRMLVSMGGGTFPTGYDGFNWRMDPQAAVRVLNGWPTALVVNEIGSTIETGASLSTASPEGHPVRLAYETFLGGAGRRRPSWDQVTALYAITGGAPWLEAMSGHTLAYLENGEHRWTPSTGGPQRQYLRQVASDAALASEIERLMTTPAP